MVLCPNCLSEVDLGKAAGMGGTGDPACPSCKDTIPLRYVRDYAAYPPIVLSLIGLTGHGKTCFLAALFRKLALIQKEWKSFCFSPLDESGMVVLREKLGSLEKGLLPKRSMKGFPKPTIVRLEGVPQLSQCHLLIYDTGGEVFGQVGQLIKFGGYVVRSPVVVWLASLEDVDGPLQLENMLTVYLEAMFKLGGDPKQQRLLFVLAKGDRLRRLGSSGALPPELEAALDRDPTGDEELLKLSRAIGHWLEGYPGLTNFVRRAGREFAGVDFLVTSALGGEPNKDQLDVSAVPRGVLAPVLLAWARQTELAREETARKRREREQALEKAQAKNAREEEERRQARIAAQRKRLFGVLGRVGRALLSGILGAVEGAVITAVLWAAIRFAARCSLMWEPIPSVLTTMGPTGVAGAAYGAAAWGIVAGVEAFLGAGNRTMRDAMRQGGIWFPLLLAGAGFLVWGGGAVLELAGQRVSLAGVWPEVLGVGAVGLVEGGKAGTLASAVAVLLSTLVAGRENLLVSTGGTLPLLLGLTVVGGVAGLKAGGDYPWLLWAGVSAVIYLVVALVARHWGAHR
ncbi:MAG: hypothetical protein FJ109_07010 [Deltaproteobacteria bacterium]|nr:hypothetical protein [Deltaproteobacteria bacterium]